MNINSAIVSGRLGRDPEIRYAPSGVAVVNFSLAVQGYAKGKSKDEQPTTWLDVKAFGKTAEFVADNAQKGSRVCVNGDLHQEKWQDKASGSNRSKVVIIARSIELFDWKNTDAAPPRPAENQPAPPEMEYDDIPF